MLDLKTGDIVLAPFHYAESEERKLRPCLVFGINAVSVSLVCITSKKLDKAFETEVVLNERESLAIGLRFASKLDFMKRDRIPVMEVAKTLGHLSALPKGRLAECFVAAKAAGLLHD